MRQISYTILHPIGDVSTEVKGNLINLINDIPYLLSFRVIPPLLVLNQVFRSGCRDAGMSGGCKWEPFEINQGEYKELVEALSLKMNSNLFIDKEFEGMENYNDWLTSVIKKYYSQDEQLMSAIQEIQKFSM